MDASWIVLGAMWVFNLWHAYDCIKVGRKRSRKPQLRHFYQARGLPYGPGAKLFEPKETR